MRIAYVTESFPPDVNGVAHTAVRVVEQLAGRGHQMLVIAPEPARGRPRPDQALGYPVLRIRTLAVMFVQAPPTNVHVSLRRWFAWFSPPNIRTYPSVGS